METIQLQCGNCQKVMAISVDHLGGQVQCPHCQSVVQTPPRSAFPHLAGSGAEMQFESVVQEQESIFTGPAPVDDLFGDPAMPSVEMPAEPKPSGESPDGFANGHAGNSVPASVAAGNDLSALQRRPLPKQSGMGGLIVLVFLVPYAFLTTLFIIYLLMNKPRHPLDMLPDPNPKNGGARQTSRERVKHDYALAAHQRVAPGESLAVRSIEIKPERVRMLKDGSLSITLRAKNLSSDTVFTPVSDDFLRATDANPTYTFVESTREKFSSLYGGHVEWRKGPPGKETPTIDGDLGPGQEGLITITTMDKYRKLVGEIARSNDTLVWRIQLRSGLVPHRGQMASVTTVIGVPFSAKQIEKEL